MDETPPGRIPLDRILRKLASKREPYQRGNYSPLERDDTRSDRYPGWSDQQEIDQPGQGRANAGGDQRVVGADVRLRIER